VSCKYLQRTRENQLMLMDVERIKIQPWVIYDLSSVPYAQEGDEKHVDCDLPGAVAFETYTTRRMAISPGVEFLLASSKDLQFQLAIDASGTSDMRVTTVATGTQIFSHSLTLNSDTCFLVPDCSYDITWISIPEEEKRDIILVVIGSCIALGASAFIEGLRPIIASKGRTGDA